MFIMACAFPADQPQSCRWQHCGSYNFEKVRNLLKAEEGLLLPLHNASRYMANGKSDVTQISD